MIVFCLFVCSCICVYVCTYMCVQKPAIFFTICKKTKVRFNYISVFKDSDTGLVQERVKTCVV